jgi:phosphopantothenoylcysteine decarboxylase/phosphopantothenate--cysteine ligase
MWNNPATQANLHTLKVRGFEVMEPAIGALTSGDTGKGRLPETLEILEEINLLITDSTILKGKKVLVTAGGTREPIDPVRYIGNNSSGKQGYAIARQAQRMGADVTLLSANVILDDIDGVEVIRVSTAQELFEAASSHFDKTDIFFMAAAVADARPESPNSAKIRKEDFQNIHLIENIDILKEITKRKKGQVVVAFAAETSHDRDSATRKMESKGADLLYLNDVSQGDIFNSETTHGEIFLMDGSSMKNSKSSKDTLARELLNQALIKLGLPNV